MDPAAEKDYETCKKEWNQDSGTRLTWKPDITDSFVYPLYY